MSHHDPAAVEKILGSVIVRLYEATHANVIDDPFHSAERFAERVRGHLRTPGFEIVIAHIDGVPVGQAFGYALPVTSTRYRTGGPANCPPHGNCTRWLDTLRYGVAQPW